MIDEFKKVFYGIYNKEVLPINIYLEIQNALNENKGEYSFNKIDKILSDYIDSIPNNIDIDARIDYLLFLLPGRFNKILDLGYIEVN